MIDMTAVERARATVASRECERIDGLVAEEAARIAHNEQQAKDGAAMIASQERNRQQRIDAHASARSAARTARDRRDNLRQHRQNVQSKLGSSRADLVEAQKVLQKHLPLDPDSFPNADEIDAHRQRFGMLDEAVRRLQARIGTEGGELRLAESAEDAVQVELEKCAAEEMRLRNEL